MGRIKNIAMQYRQHYGRDPKNLAEIPRWLREPMTDEQLDELEWHYYCEALGRDEEARRDDHNE